MSVEIVVDAFPETHRQVEHDHIEGQRQDEVDVPEQEGTSAEAKQTDRIAIHHATAPWRGFAVVETVFKKTQKALRGAWTKRSTESGRSCSMSRATISENRVAAGAFETLEVQAYWGLLKIPPNAPNTNAVRSTVEESIQADDHPGRRAPDEAIAIGHRVVLAQLAAHLHPMQLVIGFVQEKGQR